MASAAEYIEGPRKGLSKRVLVRGMLYTPNGAFVVWIRDISTAGALITSKDHLPSNSDVILKRGPVFVAGHIAWANETGASVKFYRDLSDEAVEAATSPLPHGAD